MNILDVNKKIIYYKVNGAFGLLDFSQQLYRYKSILCLKMIVNYKSKRHTSDDKLWIGKEFKL